MALSSTAQHGLRCALQNETTSKEVIDKLNSFAGGAGAASSVASVTFATGLTTITSFAVSVASATAPGTPIITYAISGGSVTVYFWKFTSSSDNTLIANTAAVNYSWVATGTS